MPLTPIAVKVYKALLTQTGTDAPQATILQNTLGNITWTRDSQGHYIGTLTAQLPILKTNYYITPGAYSIYFIMYKNNNENEICIDTVNTSGVNEDEWLFKTPITIEVTT